MIFSLARATWLAVLFAFVQPALAADPPAAPILRIEAGGHTSAIPRMAVDEAGKLLATAGYDKTIRLWSLADGSERAVLRPPIGALQEGEIYAVALSPDGHRLFAAGATGGAWDGTFSIYVYDTDHAALVSLLGGLPSPVYDLAVSPDGTRFAAGLAAGGVRVWDAKTGRPVFEDRAYTAPVRSVVMDRDDRLFVAASDGRLRSYDAAGHKLAEAAPPSGLHPWGLALSPDGGLLAVTSDSADAKGRLRIDVVSARTLAGVFTPDTTGLQGEGLLTASWATDGAGGVQLLAGGYAHTAGGYVIRRWQDFGLGGSSDVVAAHDTIRHIVRLPQGGAVYAAEDPGWGRLAPDGHVQQAPTPPLADLRPARDGRLAVSDDGTVVEFTTGAGLQRFAARDRSLGPAAKPDPSLAAAHPTAPGLTLTAWRDSSAPRLNGTPIALERGEFARSAATMPDGSGVLLGTDTHLRLVGRDGTTGPMLDIPAPAWAVTVSAGGTVAVAALLDGTLRWYSIDKTGDGTGLARSLRERVTLFAHADGQRWVLFTPEGFFDDSDRGGNELVGVHLNRARNQQPDWLSFSQAFRLFYAPDIVRARLLGHPERATARLADLGDIRARIARQPAVELRSACIPLPDQSCRPITTQAATPITLPSEARAVRLSVVVTEHGLGVGPLDLFVNDRNAGRTPAPASGEPVSVEVPLDAGPNTLQLRAYDSGGTIFTQSAPLSLIRDTPADAPKTQGRLFLFAIGIDHFTNPSLDLHFAVADGKSFVSGLSEAAAPLFGSISVTALWDEQATRANILAAFDRLAHEIRPEDTFLFYVASHGVLDEDTNRFLLVPHDMSDISTWQSMANQSIDEGTLVAALSRIEARDALLFLDTCHAGKVAADSLANMGHETGRYLLTASSSVQESLDSYDNKNGVFMYAMREALAGRAGADADGDLGVLGLGEYVSRRVGQLARQKGHDQDAIFRAAQRDLRSFPIARISRP